MRPVVRELVAAAGSSGLLAGLTLGVGWAVPPALGLAAATWFALRLLVPDGSTSADPEVAPGVRRSAQLAAVERLRSAETHVRKAAANLDGTVRSHVHELGVVLGDLAALADGDPRDVPALTSALDTVVDRAVALVTSHLRLLATSRGKLRSDDTERLSQTLGHVAVGLGELHRRLLEDDLRELAVDQRVVEELLALEIHTHAHREDSA